MAVELVAIPLWGACILWGFAIVGALFVFGFVERATDGAVEGAIAVFVAAVAFVIIGHGIAVIVSLGALAAPTAVPGAATPTTAGEVGR